MNERLLNEAEPLDYADEANFEGTGDLLTVLEDGRVLRFSRVIVTSAEDAQPELFEGV
jgi:hypothetical protein